MLEFFYSHWKYFSLGVDFLLQLVCSMNHTMIHPVLTLAKKKVLGSTSSLQNKFSVGCCDILGLSHVVSSNGKSFHWMRYSNSTLVLNLFSTVTKKYLRIRRICCLSFRGGKTLNLKKISIPLFQVWDMNGYALMTLMEAQVYATCPTLYRNL